ncbi:HEAT repeat domain-containing protein [Croceicoccus mobilis]|nr:HEAT repeat domain-containing protein [Croceicoccus mobilis]
MSASATIVVFLVLVFRRYLAEKSRAHRDKRDTAITRNYLQRVAGHRVEDFDKWSRGSRRAAISRILPLLRGGERTRLMQIAELDGVLKETLRISHSLKKKTRINAIQSLQRFGSEVCIGRLREMMARDRSQRVRLEAAFALAANRSLPPPRETLNLLRALHRLPTRLDIALLRSAAPIYPDQMVLLLEDDLPPSWRILIIDALGWTDNMGVLDVLRTFADDTNSEIRCAVLRALAKLGHPSAQAWVMSGLSDPNASVRLQAIAAIVGLGIKGAVPELVRLRDDEKLWVRLRAEQALEHFNPDNTEKRTVGTTG